jgi:DNA-binding transcriptional MerR regulator
MDDERERRRRRIAEVREMLARRAESEEHAAVATVPDALHDEPPTIRELCDAHDSMMRRRDIDAAAVIVRKVRVPAPPAPPPPAPYDDTLLDAIVEFTVTLRNEERARTRAELEKEIARLREEIAELRKDSETGSAPRLAWTR